MITLRSRSLRDLLPGVVIAVLILGLAYLAYDGIGLRPVLLMGAVVGGLVLLVRPELSPVILALAAIMVRQEYSTGTMVTLNTATLLAPALAGLWLVRGVVVQRLERIPTPADAPWVGLLAALLLSLFIGRATWDLAVPQPSRFILVQLGQWAIFAVAAIAFWLPGLTLRSQRDLERLTWTVLYMGGGLGFLRLLPWVGAWVRDLTTIVYVRAPYWVLMASLAGGLLLFHRGLSLRRRLYLVAVVGLAIYESTFHGRLSVSEWIGTWIALAVLGWLRFPRARWFALTVIVILLIIGILFPAIYEFAGGEQRWAESGGSRLVLIGRVLSAAMRNPLTGLGPAAYRVYAAVEPLQYGRAVWFHPQISSHNNYVDLFAHGGLLALALFGWLAWRILVMIYGAMGRARTPFERAYANAIGAAWVSALCIMLLADWMFPFVYNIGFQGFQASLLVWLFLGGLVVIGHPQKKESS